MVGGSWVGDREDVDMTLAKFIYRDWVGMWKDI